MSTETEIRPGDTSTVEDEVALIGRLSEHMQMKLAANRGKRHWRLCPPAYLLERLREEVEELADARSYQAWDEAADVANLAAMLATALAIEPRA